ncbi:MAG: efflux RND transporter periplasmic adaptor subunit [Proteobacteria bacterium]|nr:efflux RND transporter periplasmic adaptor subunit [Pseudomonadota bacterium]
MSPAARQWLRYALFAAIGALSAAGLWLLLRPNPVDVEVAPVERGSLRVTIDEQAETRSHDRFVITAPVAGRVLRLELHEGDTVAEGQTIAELEPAPVGERELRELEARLASARELQHEAEHRLARAQEGLAYAQRERARTDSLVARGLAAQQLLDQVTTQQRVAEQEIEAAHHRVASAAADVEAIRAELISTRSGPTKSAAILKIRAPLAGRVLRVPEKSDRVVTSGAPLAVIGDLSHLEVLIEMLSTDAVKVRLGMPVLVDGWGGERVLHARVAVVEPYAFTKVSALGVEEKRTNVIAEFIESPAPLGDGYRLQAHVVTYSTDDAIKAPAAALYPCGDAWCVFAVENGRAHIRRVRVGHRTSEYFEAQGGLAVGTELVCYPPNDLAEAARVKASRRPSH